MLKKFNILRPVLAILLIFIPLYPKFPLASVSGTYVAIRLDDIIVAIVFMIWLIYQAKNHWPILKLKITWLTFTYFAAITASLVYAILISQTDKPTILLLNYLRRFEYISLFFLTISAIKSRHDFKFTYIFTLIASVGVIIYALGQKYFHFPVISTMNAEFSQGQLLQMDVWTRISATFAGHYDLAVYLSVILVIVGGIAVTQKKLSLKMVNILFWLPLFYLLTLTASRVSTFAFYGGMCLVLILLRRYLWIIPVTIIFVFSIINSKDLNQRLLATLPALNIELSKKPTTTPIPTTVPVPIVSIIAIISKAPVATPIPTIIRHPSTEEYLPIDADVGVARSGEIRFNVEWPRAIAAFEKNPLTGTGLGSITLATDNDYLRILGESGILGFITLAAVLLFFIIKTIPKIFSKIPNTLPLIFFSALITFLINAVLIDAFEASKIAYLFWIMMGIYYQSLILES